jgi:hypothetical protein
MTTRSTLYRCHLFSFGGPQSTGIESRWTRDLVPLGETEVLTGEEVELYAKVDAATRTVTEQSRIRFDILEEDFLLTGGLDDRVLTLLGTGAVAAESEFTTASRTTVFRDVAAGSDARSALAAFRTEVAGYRDNILVLTERDGAGAAARPKVHHVIGWWLAERLEDWANAEMYFIAAIDDAEDKSEETIDVSAERAVDVTGPSLPWAASAAARRLHTLLSTGPFDWSVSGTEARAALSLLEALRPETLMEVIGFMKLGDSWQKLLRALDKHAPDELSDLQMRLDPNTRFLLPGDHVRYVIDAGELTPDEERTVPIRADGTVSLYAGKLNVQVGGLLPQDAANEMAKALLDGWLVHPSVTLAVTRRNHAYLDSRPPSGRFEFRSDLKIDRLSDAYIRELRLSRFTAFAAELRNPTPRERFALEVYLDWVYTNRKADAFLTREPAELWDWAWSRTEPPPPAPVMRYLELYTTMSTRLDGLPAEERSERIETGTRYMQWVDAHDSPAELERTSPVEVWSKMATAVMIEGMKREDAKREAALRERRHQIDLDAAGVKLDEAIKLMMRYVWHVREPEAIDVESEGYGYLVMPSDFEHEVRDVIATAFLDDLLRKIVNDDLRPQLLRTSIEREFTDWMDARPELKDALFLATSHPYVEKYEIEIDEPAWQTAIEIGISFIPIIGNIVGGYEAISGRSIFGRKLSTAERAIAGAAIVLPLAAKAAKGGKALVSANALAKTYNLGAKEANALYRAAIPVTPGSAGEKLLKRLFGDIEAGRPIRDGDSLREAEKLLGEMGMFDRATAEGFGVVDAAALRGASLAGVTETQEVLTKILGSGDLAVSEFRLLSSESKEALRAVVRREPELLRKAIEAETDTGLKRYSAALVDRVKQAGMPTEQSDALTKAVDALNLNRRKGIAGQVASALNRGTDTLLVQRLAEVGRAEGLRHEGAVWTAQLRKRAAHHRGTGNVERAREIDRDIRRIEQWLGATDNAAAATVLDNEARLLAEAIDGSALAFRVREGAGSTLQHLWLRFRINKMPGPLTAAQAREAFVEYVGHASKNFLGNYGEFEVAFRLGRTHILLKAPDGLVNLPGTDLVAIPRTGGPTLIIDNKALNAAQVDSVTALTRNLGGNFLDDLDEFEKLAGDANVPVHLKLTINRMTRARAELEAAGLLELSRSAKRSEAVQKQIIDILKKNDLEVVVTNAGGQASSISDDLADLGLDFLELNKPVSPAVTPAVVTP